uniref:Uncharacterized protein n=1 Tax=Panagrolaimus superbus TaxID=310955 RepID=A0A914YM11_9BILA
MAVAEAGDLEALDLAPRQIRHVDVEDGVSRQRIGLEPGNDLHRSARGGLEMFRIVVAGNQRDRHRRQPEEATFHRRRDGAGVDHVIAEVGGIVDAGHDNVRFELEQPGQRQVHAVGRSAGHRDGVMVDALEADRQVQGQRIAGAGAITVGRDHRDLVSGLAQHRSKHPDACGVDAIVVTDQDSHLRFNRLIFQEFDSVTVQCGRDRRTPLRKPSTLQGHRLLCRMRAAGPTLSAVMTDIEPS